MLKSRETRDKLYRLYRLLIACYGPQYWWAGETPFEVMTGAILTQSAAWTNVEKAIANLKEAGALSPRAFRDLSQDQLALLVRPSGYFNAKARKLKAMAEWLEGYNDDIEQAFNKDPVELRCELLDIHGIGPETADSILLYAAGKPVFVIDAYTRRILGRIGMAPTVDSYDGWQRLFRHNLETDGPLFNEYHALLVKLGKNICRKKNPGCPSCCLAGECRYARTKL